MADKYLNDVGLRRVCDWVVGKIGGISVGGTNLLYINSGWENGSLKGITGEFVTSISCVRFTTLRDIQPATDYVISNFGNGGCFVLYFYDNNGVFLPTESYRTWIYDTTLKFTTPVNAYKYCVVLALAGFPASSILDLQNGNYIYKLEKGTIPTDWSPAPEDINGQITTLTDNYNLVSNTLATHTQEINNIDTELENKADVYWATDKFELYRTLEGNIIQLGLKSDNTVEYAPNVPLNYVRVRCSVPGLSLTLNVCSTNMIPYDSTWIRSGNVSGTWNGFYDYTYNGITYTLNGNGKITINGTATANSILYFAKSVDLPKGTFTASGCTGGSNTTYLIQMGTDDWSTGFGVPSGWDTKTLTTSKVLSKCRILVYAGTTVNNVIITPQLEYGSTKSGFEPYTGRTYPVVASGISYLVNKEVFTTNMFPCNIWVSDPANPTIEVCYNRSNYQLSMLQRQINVLSYAIAALGGE